MNSELQSTRDDLAFLRALVQAGDDNQRPFGEAYFAAGLIYGVQMLMHGAQFFGLMPNDGVPALLIGVGPTILFVPVLIWIIRRNRSVQQSGTAARAVASVFGAVGLANLALVAVIGSVALRERSFTIWMIYPCTVFVLQGMAWLVAYMMRRRGWFALVAGGWLVTAVAMAISITDMRGFVAAAGIGIWLCMALPGWVVLHNSRGGT